MELTPKQKAFADYYIETGNATESAIRAGYSKNYANAQSYKLLENVGVKNYIEERIKEIEDKRIAKAEEVLEYLTRVIRGEETEQVVVTENVGDFMSEARVIKKELSAKDRIKAAELLGKRYRLFVDKIEQKVDVNATTKLDSILEQLEEDDNE